MTTQPVWPRVLARVGLLGRAIEFKASVALQLRRRRQLEELDIFDGTRIGYPHRYSSRPCSLPVTPTWCEELAQRSGKGGRQYVMIRNEQLHWLASQLKATALESQQR